jgi:L-iditol 2-dehydrogenase
MKSACLTGLGKLELLEIPTPKIEAPDDVLVRVKSCGICGSDIHYYREGRIGDARCKYPHFMGHEPSGVVEAAPKDSPFKAGDRVAIEPGHPCGECEWCKAELFNLCPKVRFLASPGMPGAFQEHLVVKASQLFKIPDSISFDEAAVLEPLGVAYHIIAELAELQFGETIAVFGAGPIGLLTLAFAKYSGASAAYITDPLDYRLEFAEAYAGADGTIDPSSFDVADSIMELTNGRGVDVAVDAAGTQQSIDHAMACAAIGGRTLLAGIPEVDIIEYDPHIIRRKELRIFNVRRSNKALEQCIPLIEEACMDLKPYTTHTFKLDQVAEAFDTVANHKDGVIKAMINP